MNHALKVTTLVILSALAMGLAVQAGSLTMTILHTNDVHAHYDSFQPWGDVLQGGFARMKTAVDTVRDSTGNVLLLDAGDQFQGTLYFNVAGARVVADVMNAVGYDAMCVGNHEFDSGPGELASFIDLAEFPVLSANIDTSASADLASDIAAHHVFAFGDEQVGVIGLTTEQASELSSPGPNVLFTDVAAAAQAAVDALEAQGVNKIVALTHLGYSEDLLLGTRVSGIDVIVGGHSHTKMTNSADVVTYPNRILGADGAPVYVVTAQEWGKYLGQLEVAFDEAGFVTSATGTPLFIDESIAEDAAVLDILSVYSAEIDTLKSTVIGQSSDLLNGERADVRGKETNLGNLICDAILWRTASSGAQIALQNGGGIRATVSPGDVTMGNVIEVLPYGNQITIVDLTGAQMLEALENGVSQIEDGAGRFPQVGGLRYTFSRTAPAGSRIQSVEILTDSRTYAALDPAAVYRVATNNYVANGGDGYSVLKAGFGRYDTGLLLSDTLAEYIEAHSPVSASLEGRITEK